MKSKNPLVTVVVPVYNVENYVEKCLKSIMKQTYTNLEIIVVNDGSTDNSEKIILNLARIDSKIKYIKKENEGLSSARNLAISKATGKYICFVDSDDWIEPEHIEKLVMANLFNDSEIAISNIAYVFKDGTYRKRTPLIIKQDVVNNKTCFCDLLESNGFRFHAVNKLYQTELYINNSINYPVGKIYEDVFTTYKLIFAAKKISYVPITTYNYLQERDGSILTSKFKENRFDILEAMDEIQRFMKLKNIEARDSFTKFVISNIISLMNYLAPVYKFLNKEQKIKYKKNIKNTYYRFNMYGYLKINILSISEKIRYFIILNMFFLYIWLYNILLIIRSINKK